MSHQMSLQAGNPAPHPPLPAPGTAEQCASFLMALKHRSMSPELIEDASQCLFETLKQNEPNEPNGIDSYVHTGTSSTGRQGRSSGRNDANVLSLNDQDQASTGIPLALPDDEYWLSDLQCYVRSHCCEFFTATEADVKISSSASTRVARQRAASTSSNAGSTNSSTGGRRGPITVGRVGIRCIFCREAPSRASQSTSFPSQISGIYGAVVMMQCRHFPNCHMMPHDVRETLASIKGTRNVTPPPGALPLEKGSAAIVGGTNTPGRQQYWAESARKLGLIDTDEGIRFASNCDGLSSSKLAPAGSYYEMSHHVGEEGRYVSSNITQDPPSKKNQVTPDLSPHDDAPMEVPDLSLPSSLNALMGETTLVCREDKDLIPDYLFVAMAQMKPCALTDIDKVGCYKDRELGFVGMSCKHCGGQPGFGKYFPATVRSLAQTTTSQTILKHIGVKCRLCPADVRQAVVALQKNAPNEKTNYARGPTNDGRPRYGSRKVFFQRVWGRLHGEEVPEIPTEYETTAQPPPPSKSKKRSRDKEAAVVTPNDSGEEEVSSLDGATDSDSSVASSSGDEAIETDSESDDDSSSILTDNMNRTVRVRVGGPSQRQGRRSNNRRRSAPILPTKTSAMRKRGGIHSLGNGGSGKRTRLSQ